MSKTTTSLTVLVPVYNEQYLVTTSLNRLAKLADSPLLDRIQVVVVDDCSRDSTQSILKSFQQKLKTAPWDRKVDWFFVRHDHNQGKGAAVRTGLEYADSELTVIHDADLEYHPRDLLQMIPLFLDEDADAVFGSRFMAGGFKRALFFRHSIGNHMLTFLCDLASDLNLTDMETCYKMVRTDLFRSIPLESRDFRIEPELTIKLAKRGARVFEVPISYSGRTYQEGKKIGWKDGVKALLAIIKFGASDRICKPDKYGSEVSIRLNGAPEYNRWMADSLRPYLGKRVLELGAGFGSLTLMLIPRTRYVACDTNPLFVRELQKLTDTRPYLEVAEIDPADPNSLPKDASFDSVLCQNVLEHVEDDSAALNSIRNALETGGRAIILVPQNPKLFGALDDALGHRRRYTREQLMHLAEKCGFRCVQILPFNRPSSLIWWLNSRVLRRKQLTYFQVRMLNFLAPVFKTIDPLLPVTPLSLIAVFEKS